MAPITPILRLPAEASAQAGYKASLMLSIVYACLPAKAGFMPCLEVIAARSKCVTYSSSVTKLLFISSLLFFKNSWARFKKLTAPLLLALISTIGACKVGASPILEFL